MLKNLRRFFRPSKLQPTKSSTSARRARRLRIESLETRVQLAALVQYSASATDLAGAPLTTINAGTEFLLNVRVKDLRSEPTGVFAAYVDVGYNPNLVAITGPIEYATNFANGHTGETETAGLVDEVGAFAGLGPTAPAVQLVFKLRMQALAEGTAAFTLDAADSAPIHDTLLYGINQSVVSSDQSFVGANLSIVVPNLPPVITQAGTNAESIGAVTAGQVVNLSASFTDTALSDTHTASIAWGDGSTSAAVVTQGSGAGTLAGNHVYARGGLYAATITLRDQALASTTRSLDVFVTGTSVVGRTLYSIGTTGNDTVSLASQKKGIAVTASYSPTPVVETFPLVGIDRIVVMSGDGNDNVTIASKVKRAAMVFGGAGGDTLRGGGASNILIGDEGHDLLVGGSKRDILIGGMGNDNLQGQGGDDILIAGRTTHDANSAALLSLLAEWERTNLKAPGRVTNLRNGGGHNANVRLNVASVLGIEDDGIDSLSDSSGANWFWLVAGQDTVVKKSKTTVLN